MHLDKILLLCSGTLLQKLHGSPYLLPQVSKGNVELWHASLRHGEHETHSSGLDLRTREIASVLNYNEEKT